MSAYIQIPKYCRSRGYIRNTYYYTGLNMVGGRLFFDKAVEDVSEFSIFPSWFCTKLKTRTKELDVVVDNPELITYFDRIAESWKEIDEEPCGKTYRLKSSYFDFRFNFALSELVEPEIWISKEGNKIKLVQGSDYTDETLLNTLEIRSSLMLLGLSPEFRYGAVPSIIRTRPGKKQTTFRSLLSWVYKDDTLTKILPKKISDPDEAVICFDNELNNASMKVGEKKLVEICFDYTRRVPC